VCLSVHTIRVQHTRGRHKSRFRFYINDSNVYYIIHVHGIRVAKNPLEKESEVMVMERWISINFNRNSIINNNDFIQHMCVMESNTDVLFYK